MEAIIGFFHNMTAAQGFGFAGIIGAVILTIYAHVIKRAATVRLFFGIGKRLFAWFYATDIPAIGGETETNLKDNLRSTFADSTYGLYLSATQDKLPPEFEKGDEKGDEKS